MIDTGRQNCKEVSEEKMQCEVEITRPTYVMVQSSQLNLIKTQSMFCQTAMNQIVYIYTQIHPLNAQRYSKKPDYFADFP